MDAGFAESQVGEFVRDWLDRDALADDRSSFALDSGHDALTAVPRPSAPAAVSVEVISRRKIIRRLRGTQNRRSSGALKLSGWTFRPPAPI